MSGQRLRVLLGGDPELCDTVSSALSDEGLAVEAAVDAAAVLEQARHGRPQLALLDTALSGGPDALMVCRTLCRSAVPVMFLRARDGQGTCLDAFDAGADDYLVVPFLMAELLARVNVILRRSGARAERTFALADLVLDEAGRQVTRDGHEVALTPTEFRLLTALLRRPGRVVAKSQLLAEVWQYADADPNLVEVHVLSLRRKLEAHGPRLVHTVRGSGYVARP